MSDWPGAPGPDGFRHKPSTTPWTKTHKNALTELLRHDPTLGQSPADLATRTAAFHQRGKPARSPGKAGVLCGGSGCRRIWVTTFIQPGWPSSPGKVQFAPVNLINDFGERRRIATLAAQMSELDTVLTDAAIAMFERLTGQLFSRSKNQQERSWSASKTRVGRLIQLFGGTLDAMVRARQQKQDPFAVLDEEIGWDRLLKSRDEIAAFGDLATEDALPLAAGRYTQLRRFAPAFLEAFDFKVPEAGQDLRTALELLKEHNRTGKRNLPDIVPMPFASQHWKSLILENGRPKRRVYETAVIATLRDRLSRRGCLGRRQPRLPPLRRLPAAAGRGKGSSCRQRTGDRRADVAGKPAGGAAPAAARGAKKACRRPSRRRPSRNTVASRSSRTIQ